MECTQSKAAKAVVVTPLPPPATLSTAETTRMLACLELESAPSNVIMEATNHNAHDAEEEVITYTTGAVVPYNVVHVQIDLAVVSIPNEVFKRWHIPWLHTKLDRDWNSSITHCDST